MSGTMYYRKPVLLNREKHRQRRVKPSAGFGFARQSVSLPLAGAEFTEACKDYAIVFARQGGKVVPLALLGLRDGENLFVDGQDRWTAAYVPAFVRRYPFVLAELGEQMGACVDEGFEGIDDPAGEPLFDEQGNNTPFLQNALDFLQRYQQEHLRTQQFCQRLEDAGLLTEMSARADLLDGSTFTVAGLMVVDEKKLAALPDDVALWLFRSGEMHLVSMHLLSLSNLHRLVDRMAERKAPAQAASTAPGPAAKPRAGARRAARPGTKQD
jgi:hypothetical protein